MVNGSIAVWFNEADKQRYDALGIGTELKDKVKALFYDFLDKSELDRLEKAKFLSHENIEQKFLDCCKKYSVPIPHSP